jgi:predicted phage terminase large subunit-like protein
MLAKKKANVKHISLPGEIRNYKKEVKPKELIKKYKNDLLDPKRMNWEVMKDMEADLGQYGYAGQVGQRPTPPGGGMFKVDHFQVIDKLPSEVNWMNTVRYWDKAGTQDGGAYTVGCKMLRLKNDKYIIMDVKRGQWATEQREDIIRQTAQADGNSVAIYMEQEPGSGGKDSIDSSIRNLAGYSVYADRPTGDKVFRADPYSVQVNNGNVMLLRADWNHEFIEEHRNFPFSTYKDQVDASSGAFNKLARKRIAGPILR